MKHLSWTQRKGIYYGLKAGKSNAQIAREIGVHRSTVGREIVRSGMCRETYEPLKADDRSWLRQQLAMWDRFDMYTKIGGVRQFTKLQRRENHIYTYISHTHFNLCVRQDYYESKFQYWNSTYAGCYEKNRYMPDDFYSRFRISSKQWKLFGTTNGFSPLAAPVGEQSGKETDSRSLYYPVTSISGQSGQLRGRERFSIPGKRCETFFEKPLQRQVRNWNKSRISQLNSAQFTVEIRILSRFRKFQRITNRKDCILKRTPDLSLPKQF